MRLSFPAVPLKRFVPVRPSTGNRTYEDKAPGRIYLRIWSQLKAYPIVVVKVACSVHIYELVTIPSRLSTPFPVPIS